MTLEQLRIFVAVAERQHVTQGAKALNLTQSAASAAIAALEGQYHTRLFDRVGRGVALTDAGALFQQMLAIARALVSDPKVLLLDEPSQGLAPLVVRELARVIRQLRESGVTILLIEQNLKLAEQVADRVAIMVKGRVVYDASAAAFTAEQDAVRRTHLTV